MNNARYDLTISPVLDLTNNGPAKSIPTFENGVDCLTLKSGNAATGGDLKSIQWIF